MDYSKEELIEFLDEHIDDIQRTVYIARKRNTSNENTIEYLEKSASKLEAILTYLKDSS